VEKRGVPMVGNLELKWVQRKVVELEQLMVRRWEEVSGMLLEYHKWD
jgi:hypothetical protein